MNEYTKLIVEQQLQEILEEDRNYIILREKRAYELVNLTDLLIKNGYTPAGGLCFVPQQKYGESDLFYQALYKVVKVENHEN